VRATFVADNFARCDATRVAATSLGVSGRFAGLTEKDPLNLIGGFCCHASKVFTF
jgi:hypothetical protein